MYGTRSAETIEKYASQDSRFLIGKGVKFIIAACGTVSSVAPHILNSLPVPAIGVVEPAAAAAVEASKNLKIGVVGTAATINSGSFRQAILRLQPNAEVFEQACPLFVPLVENGWIDQNNEITRLTAEKYLAPLKAEGIDTLLLGCTHFPLLMPVIRKVLGPDVALVIWQIHRGVLRAAAYAGGAFGLPRQKGQPQLLCQRPSGGFHKGRKHVFGPGNRELNQYGGYRAGGMRLLLITKQKRLENAEGLI